MSSTAAVAVTVILVVALATDLLVVVLVVVIVTRRGVRKTYKHSFNIKNNCNPHTLLMEPCAYVDVVAIATKGIHMFIQLRAHIHIHTRTHSHMHTRTH